MQRRLLTRLNNAEKINTQVSRQERRKSNAENPTTTQLNRQECHMACEETEINRQSLITEYQPIRKQVPIGMGLLVFLTQTMTADIFKGKLW
jgi:hypothetical protein